MQHKWEDSSFGAAPNNEIPLLLSSPHSTQLMGEVICRKVASGS